MKTNMGIVISVLALASMALSISGAQATSGVPRPLAGHWKIEKGFSEVSSGALIVAPSRARAGKLSFKPETPYCASTALVRVSGNFRLYSVADNKHGASDNTPDWGLTKSKRHDSIRVTAHQGKTVLHGTLSLNFGSKNDTRVPVKFVEGEFSASGCNVVLGGAHV
jgi:hypothetical protein